MKLLHNPVVVGVLAVAAVFLMYWNVVRPIVGGGSRYAKAPAVQQPQAPPIQTAKTLIPQAPAASASLGSQEKVVGPGPSARAELDTNATSRAQAPALRTTVQERCLDMGEVQAHAPSWTDAPRRDPFRGRYEPHAEAKKVLTLKAIWRQTGVDLAVINGHVVQPGDSVLEFSIETIDSDSVWVVGPNGREELTFGLAPVPTRLALESP